jgi:hypothetical protein
VGQVTLGNCPSHLMSHSSDSRLWYLYMFSNCIPESTMTLVSKMFTTMQEKTLPPRFLVFHLVVSMILVGIVRLRTKSHGV